MGKCVYGYIVRVYNFILQISQRMVDLYERTVQNVYLPVVVVE